jgi:tetratricopeptide (TPR) repeat protein
MSWDKNRSDLDYLSQLGYDSVSGAEVDIVELTKKIKIRSQTNALNLSFVSLIVGIFLGITLFFVIYDGPKENRKIMANVSKAKVELPVKEKELMLDTFFISEKFMKRGVSKKLERRREADTVYKETVSPEIMSLKQAEISVSDSVKENTIQFSYNASVKYVQDLKVCNYYTLYFKGGKLLPVGGEGVPADRAGKESHHEIKFREAPTVYLHEVIEEGLKQYNKGEYLKSVLSFNTVSAITNKDLNCRFYTAMNYFQLKKYSQAIELFKTCIEDECNVFKEESEFYQALSLYNSGNNSDAEELFRQIKEEKGFYADRAAKYF